MKVFWKRREPLDLDAQLRARRPEPRGELVKTIADDIHAVRRRGAGRLQLAFAGGLSAVMLVGLAAVGGVGYAASTVQRATHDFGWNPVASAASKASAEGQYGHKVKMCHKGKTIDVDEHAVPAHLKQGDKRGACPKGAGKPAKHKVTKPKAKHAKAKPKHPPAKKK